MEREKPKLLEALHENFDKFIAESVDEVMREIQRPYEIMLS